MGVRLEGDDWPLVSYAYGACRTAIRGSGKPFGVKAGAFPHVYPEDPASLSITNIGRLAASRTVLCGSSLQGGTYIDVGGFLWRNLFARTAGVKPAHGARPHEGAGSTMVGPH